MKIAIGCDHGGIGLKAEIVPLLQELGHTVDDKGCYSTDSVDYPDFAKAVCAQVQNNSCERGILICGTGVGMSMVANRFEGIRAALGNELFTARMSREHWFRSAWRLLSFVIRASPTAGFDGVFLP